MDGINGLTKETPECFFAPFAMWGHYEKITIYEPGSRSHQTLNLIAPWSWTSNLQKCDKYISVADSHLVYCILIQWPQKTKTVFSFQSFSHHHANRSGWWVLVYLLHCERKKNPNPRSLELLVWETFVFSNKGWKMMLCRMASDDIIPTLPILMRWWNTAVNGALPVSVIAVVWAVAEAWRHRVLVYHQPQPCRGQGVASGRTGWTRIPNLDNSFEVLASF